MNLPAVFNIAEICARHGVKQVVLSPGSRCAPLTLAFVRHPAIQVRTVSDERAAAFIGLGMAVTTRQPVALVCTSGTAALNYAPAVAEAFYQQVPLLVLTADRPAEWIDQLDGQTIRQENVYGAHVKRSYTFPPDTQHPDAVWFGERLLSEALLAAQAYPPGPVHVNIPLREPLYPEPEEQITFSSAVKIIQELPNDYPLTNPQIDLLQQELATFARVLVVAGQQPYQPELAHAVARFGERTKAVLVADSISNLHSLPAVIRRHDVFLQGQATSGGAALQPDLLITCGLSVISKNLKQFLRAFPPRAHWHLQPAGPVADPFQSLTRIIRTQPIYFFAALAAGDLPADTNYQLLWQQREQQAGAYLQEFLSQNALNEFTVFYHVLNQLPNGSLLHLANSMAVRYANIIGLKPDQTSQVFANRGTSGIDGCTSTAVGAALSSPQLTVLITGDLAFFYDRNALWHNYLPDNLRIILLNNHAGGIFRLIDGPRQQPELAEYFETHQALNAQQTARDFNLRYYTCQSLLELQERLPAFWAGGAGILEIVTQSETNAAFFAAYKNNSPF